jgi:dephospho-CoA kinase
MLKVGLTGGIGSGKSTVAKVFETLGIPVYYADDAAKKLMNEDAELKKKITDLFGADVYKNHQLNRQHLAQIVFNNPDKLAQLNALVHPATIQDAAEWMKKQTTLYCIKEAALIFESDAHKSLDYVIGVYSPTQLRILRVMLRDNITEQQVKQRISKQMNEETKMGLCKFVIKNDEESLIIPQVLKIHQQLIGLQ